jgi:hypothetical protein
LKTPNDVEQLAGQVEAQCTELAGRIVRESPLRASDKTSQKTVALVDNLSNAICSAADLV